MTFHIVLFSIMTFIRMTFGKMIHSWMMFNITTFTIVTFIRVTFSMTISIMPFRMMIVNIIWICYTVCHGLDYYNANWNFAKSHYVKCHYFECHGAQVPGRTICISNLFTLRQSTISLCVLLRKTKNSWIVNDASLADKIGLLPI